MKVTSFGSSQGSPLPSRERHTVQGRVRGSWPYEWKDVNMFADMPAHMPTHTLTHTHMHTCPIAHSHTPQTHVHIMHSLAHISTPTYVQICLHSYAYTYVCMHKCTSAQIHLHAFPNAPHSVAWFHNIPVCLMPTKPPSCQNNRGTLPVPFHFVSTQIYFQVHISPHGGDGTVEGGSSRLCAQEILPIVLRIP